MMLRKPSCALSLLLSLLLLAHMILTGAMMLGTLQFFPWFAWVTKALMVAFILHTVLSCYLLFTKRTGAKTSKYAASKRIAYAQRATAIALVALMPGHILSFSQHQLPSMIAFLVQLLVVVVSGAHMGLSIPKALEGLGIIAGDKGCKTAWAISLLLSAAVCVYSIAGFCALATQSGILS